MALTQFLCRGVWQRGSEDSWGKRYQPAIRIEKKLSTLFPFGGMLIKFIRGFGELEINGIREYKKAIRWYKDCDKRNPIQNFL
jgi:hypothetical protein